MMYYLLSQLLWGALQGITEFLPVSSSAHLVFLSHWISVPKGMDRLSFFTGLHFGTLVALLFFFRDDLMQLVKSAVKDKASRMFVFNIMVTTIITGIIALVLEGPADLFTSQPRMVAGVLFAMGLALISSRFLDYREDSSIFELKHAILLGIIQAIAVFPGISRSGSTILALLMMGFSPKDAFKLSFIAGIPIIFLAFVHESLKVKVGDMMYILPGMFFSFVFGLIALSLLKKVVIGKRLYLFGIYCIIISGIICILIPR